MNLRNHSNSQGRRAFFRLAILLSIPLSYEALANWDDVAHSGEELSSIGRLILAGDLWNNLAEPYRSIAIGDAASPGYSTVVSSQLAREKLRLAGFEGELPPLKDSVSVRAIEQLYPTQLLEPMFTQELSRIVKQGVEISSVKISKDAKADPASHLKIIDLPALPTKAGKQSLMVSFDLERDGKSTYRGQAKIILDITPMALIPDVKKGQELKLTISRGPATISAQGISLGEGDIGSTMLFKVTRTGRIVRGVLKTTGEALIIEGN